MVPANRLQPSSDGPRGHRDVFAAVSRSVQLLSIRWFPLEIDLVGAAMHSRFVAEGKPGATTRSGAELFDVVEWWSANDSLLSQHGWPPDRNDRQPNADRHSICSVASSCRKQTCRYPIAPQKWHFRQSIDYSITANRAVLDFASKHREDFLFNIYRNGEELDRARQPRQLDVHPQMIEEVQTAHCERARPTGRAQAMAADTAARCLDAGVPPGERGA